MFLETLRGWASLWAGKDKGMICGHESLQESWKRSLVDVTAAVPAPVQKKRRLLSTAPTSLILLRSPSSALVPAHLGWHHGAGSHGNAYGAAHPLPLHVTARLSREKHHYIFRKNSTNSVEM